MSVVGLRKALSHPTTSTAVGFRLGRNTSARNGAAMPDTFTIAAVQMKIAPDRETNLAKAEAAIAGAAKQGAQVVCLPELFTGYYFCQKEDVALFDLAEPIPGPSEERLAAAAKL